MKRRFKERTIYKNENGKIICSEDMMFGGTRYMLFDADGSYVKDISVPFKVADYLWWIKNTILRGKYIWIVGKMDADTQEI